MFTHQRKVRDFVNEFVLKRETEVPVKTMCLLRGSKAKLWRRKKSDAIYEGCVSLLSNVERGSEKNKLGP